MSKFVVTLSEQGLPDGIMEKLEAHRVGKFHLAFSVLVVNDKGEVLLQKRAAGKYHSAGLWSNTCCSHPEAPENIEEYAHLRLKAEMGFDCPFLHCGYFDYKVDFGNGLTEYERDHVFLGVYNNDPIPDPEEAETFKWVAADHLKSDLAGNPGNYSFWFPQVLKLALPEKF